MDQKVLTNVKVIEIQDSISQENLLTKMGSLAVEAGWAKPGYIQALLERESKYATGLHADGMDVAIPHADPEWTNEPGMVVALLDHAVDFEPMGGVGDVVKANFVFMLVIPDAEAHIEFLSAFSTFIEDKSHLETLAKTRDIDWFLGYLNTAMMAN